MANIYPNTENLLNSCRMCPKQMKQLNTISQTDVLGFPHPTNVWKNNRNFHSPLLCSISSTYFWDDTHNTHKTQIIFLWLDFSFPLNIISHCILPPRHHQWAWWVSHECCWALPCPDELQMFMTKTCLSRCDSYPEIFH